MRIYCFCQKSIDFKTGFKFCPYCGTILESNHYRYEYKYTKEIIRDGKLYLFFYFVLIILISSLTIVDYRSSPNMKIEELFIRMLVVMGILIITITRIFRLKQLKRSLKQLSLDN